MFQPFITIFALCTHEILFKIHAYACLDSQIFFVKDLSDQNEHPGGVLIAKADPDDLLKSPSVSNQYYRALYKMYAVPENVDDAPELFQENSPENYLEFLPISSNSLLVFAKGLYLLLV